MTPPAQTAAPPINTVKLNLPDDICSYPKSIEIFDTVATQNNLTEPTKLAILFNAISSNGNYAKIEPFLQKNTANYEELKRYVLQASRAYAVDEHALLNSPTHPDPLRAYQIALDMVPDAKDVTLLDMIKVHLTPQVYLQLKFGTGAADEPKDGKLRNRLVEYVKAIHPESFGRSAERIESSEIERLREELYNLKKTVTLQQANQQINAIQSNHRPNLSRTRIENNKCGFHIEFQAGAHTCMPQCMYFDPYKYTEAMPNGAMRIPRRPSYRNRQYQPRQNTAWNSVGYQQQQPPQPSIPQQDALQMISTQMASMGTLLEKLTQTIEKKN